MTRQKVRSVIPALDTMTLQVVFPVRDPFEEVPEAPPPGVREHKS